MVGGNGSGVRERALSSAPVQRGGAWNGAAEVSS